MSTLETIYDALRESHEIQRTWCTRLVRTGPANPQRRREAFRTLRLELAAHAAAEERYFYTPILMHDAGLDLSRHALAEHHDMDELVEDLIKLDPAGDAFGAKARELTHKVRHHLKEEEKEFFQVSGKLIDEAQKATLTRRYLKDYARMKTKLAQEWGFAAERATVTDTQAVKRVRRTL